MQARAWVLIAVLVLAIGSLWVSRQRHRPTPPQPPPPTATAPVAAAQPSPTPVPTPNPEAAVERHSTFVLPWESEPTPSPTAPEEEPTVRPGPSPTPEVPECLAFSYSAGYVPGRLGRSPRRHPGGEPLRARPRASRGVVLGGWFPPGGPCPDRARPPLRPDPAGGAKASSIVLPGSIDWYDRIDVRVIAPSGP